MLILIIKFKAIRQQNQQFKLPEIRGNYNASTVVVCGYIYDPEIGEPDNRILPGTLFEDLPETYVCPVCGAPKDQFEKVD